MDDANDEEEEWSNCPGQIESIRTSTGLEIGCIVDWPGSIRLELSTVLPETSMAAMFDGTQWAGTRIWRASLVCLHYLAMEIQANRVKCHNLLELGSGLGVPAMVLHSMTGCNTILSDKEDLVTQLESNVKSNFPDESKIQARSLDWSAEGIKELIRDQGDENRPFDVIINCDCIYQPLYGESWRALLDCQYALLNENSAAVVVTSVERRRVDGIEDYIQKAKDLGLQLHKIDIPFEHPPEVEIYILSLKS